MKKIEVFIIIISAFIPLSIIGQPVPDETSDISLTQPRYEKGKGPEILIDEGHNNLHKKEGGLLMTSKLLEADGYIISSNTNKITSEVLSTTSIYVIVNALNSTNLGNWTLPTPSAFTVDEIKALSNWVKNGGRLLLVADHMPFGGAIQELAREFNIEWNNGFAMRKEQNWPPSTFSLKKETLLPSPVTTELMNDEKVNEIISFTGSAFKAPDAAIPFMVFDSTHNLRIPEVAWQFDKNTETISADGWAQGAIIKFEKGKVIALGEAAMITAQIINNNFKVGFNSPQATQNKQLILNIFHELSSK